MIVYLAYYTSMVDMQYKYYITSYVEDINNYLNATSGLNWKVSLLKINNYDFQGTFKAITKEQLLSI